MLHELDILAVKIGLHGVSVAVLLPDIYALSYPD
jgi:hypothetical protein